MAAANEARAHGMSVLLLDENAAPGGQVHRAVESRTPKDEQDRDGAKLAAAFRASGTDYRPGATLWAVEPATEGGGGKVFWSEGGAARSVATQRLILCAGATERPLPIPGWTLPGVMSVGAAQIALKTAGLVPEGQVWLAGQGPLLWLYAVQALERGGRLAGIIDLSPPGGLRRALPHLGRALKAPEYLWRGLQWQRRVRRAGVAVTVARALRAEGEGRLARIVVDGVAHPADLLLLHDGVVPNTQVTRAIPGCVHGWDPVQACWRPGLDLWGNTAVAGVMVAGDSAGIGGARAAVHAGRIAALEAARALGRITTDERDARAGPLRLLRDRQLAPRLFLDAMFPPLPPAAIADEVVLCRCEEVTAGRVRQAVALGCLGANQTKAFTRAGMGPCQGRICGPAVHGVIAAARGVAGGEVDPFRTRFPTKPLTLGELAALAGPL
ncbi:FAD/NAD(P)-binding oxidoreductase [Roseomonas sp. BU-1]|uniref:FAD/NAD(P)-binding oxidoreductase n=2 Tax=Falsiroseomonas selenitidurans TaxID=2716335 RepID=A0ABX1E0Z4_9PROT|nr:FAD/NAD(P)-binding oxidoreductase [Falsiroseomonas selenitidurans]